MKKLEEQSRQLWHSSGIYLQPKIHEYVEKLVAKMPGNLKVSVVYEICVQCTTVTLDFVLMHSVHSCAALNVHR